MDAFLLGAYYDSRYSLIVSSPKILTKGISLNNTKLRYKYMVDLAILFGADRDIAETNMLDVMVFEKKYFHRGKFTSIKEID